MPDRPKWPPATEAALLLKPYLPEPAAGGGEAVRLPGRDDVQDLVKARAALMLLLRQFGR